MNKSVVLLLVSIFTILALTSCNKSSSSKPEQPVVSNLSQDQIEKFRSDWIENRFSEYFEDNKNKNDETEISEGTIFSIDDKGELSVTFASSKYSYDNEIEFPAEIQTVKYGFLVQDEKGQISVKMNEDYKKELIKKYNISEEEAKKSLDKTLMNLRINEKGLLVSSQPDVPESAMTSSVYKRITFEEKQKSLKRAQVRIDSVKSKLIDASSILLGKSFELTEEETIYMNEKGEVQNTFKKLAKDIPEETTSGTGDTQRTLPNAKAIKFLEIGKVLINEKVTATAQYQLNGDETQLKLNINTDSDNNGYFRITSGTLLLTDDSFELVRKYQYKNEKDEIVLVRDTHKFKLKK